MNESSALPTLQGYSDGLWFFSDGSTLPVVSGGSDGQGGFPSGGTDAVEPAEDGGQGSTEYSLGHNFLQEVPEEHRSILEPYVKKWDAGVTRRFQDLHSQLSPYEELGADPGDLSQAYQLYQLMEEDPQRVYEALRAQFEEQEELEEAAESGQFQGLPPEIQQELQQQRQVLEALAEFVTNQQRTAQESQEDQELDDYLGLLQTEFGEFDEDYVVAKMYRGMSGEDAVRAWKESVQKAANGGVVPPPSLPPILSGGGVVPAEQQNLSKMPRKDVKNLVAQLMSQANQE